MSHEEVTKIYAVEETSCRLNVFAVLEGSIFLDETFFSLIKSKKKYQKNCKQYRSISRNKLCVAAAYGEASHILLICENTSKPSLRSTWKALGSHINPESHLIHDGKQSHSVFIVKMNLTHDIYDSNRLMKLPDKENSLDLINEIHSLPSASCVRMTGLTETIFRTRQI